MMMRYYVASFNGVVPSLESSSSREWCSRKCMNIFEYFDFLSGLRHDCYCMLVTVKISMKGSGYHKTIIMVSWPSTLLSPHLNWTLQYSFYSKLTRVHNKALINFSAKCAPDLFFVYESRNSWIYSLCT